MPIKYGSIIIIRKKQSLFNTMLRSICDDIEYYDHQQIENINVYFDDMESMELKESLSLIDIKKTIKPYSNVFLNKILPLTIDKFNGDNKITLLYYRPKTNMFDNNKNYNNYKTYFSYYNCSYTYDFKETFAIFHIVESNRCLFAYDDDVLDKDYVSLILNKIFL